MSATTGAEVGALLGRYSWTVVDEARLQAGIAAVLDAAAVDYTREARLAPGERVDFLTGDGLAVEVKVAGAAPDVLRQLQRYAAADDVRALLLVTTRTSHRMLPLMVSGKRLHVTQIRGVG